MILSALNLFPWLKGFEAVVALHVFINVGLVAVIFENLLVEKAGGYLELARVEGASLSKIIFSPSASGTTLLSIHERRRARSEIERLSDALAFSITA